MLAFYRGVREPTPVPLNDSYPGGASTITMPESAPASEHLRKDHRVIEERLDILLAALLRLTPELIPETSDRIARFRISPPSISKKRRRSSTPSSGPLLSDLLGSHGRAT